MLDSRLGYHFISGSFKVFLKVKPEEAARRVFADKRKEEKENVTEADTVENIKKRRESEKLRYKKFYDLDPFEESQYDLVVDTTGITPEEVAEKIIGAVEK